MIIIIITTTTKQSSLYFCTVLPAQAASEVEPVKGTEGQQNHMHASLRCSRGLTGRYPPGALARRARNAVAARELHIRELGDVLLTAQPVQRLVVVVPVQPLVALVPRHEPLPAASRPRRPHGSQQPSGGCGQCADRHRPSGASRAEGRCCSWWRFCQAGLIFPVTTHHRCAQRTQVVFVKIKY